MLFSNDYSSLSVLRSLVRTVARGIAFLPKI